MSGRFSISAILCAACFAASTLQAQTVNVATSAAAGAATATRPSLTGERLFLQCRACHNLTSVQGGKIGPALGGLFGRGAGSAPGYTYSSGLKSYGGTWTDARLDAFLAGPNRTINGTKMAFAGIPDSARRAAIIAYLKANTQPAR